MGNVKFKVTGTMEVGSDGFVELLLDNGKGTQVLHAHRYPSAAKDKKTWAVWDCWVWLFKNYPRRTMEEKK